MTAGDPTAGVATWTEPAWRAAAVAWADERLARHGLARTGEPAQPHVRAWSTAFRLPVRGGVVWLKAVGPGSAQEAPLAQALGGWVPERVLVPLAVHPGRRLLLLPDGGPTLRAAGAGATPAAWEAMLAEHAVLQVALAPRAGEVLDLGVPDHRPERLPQLAVELLSDDAQRTGREGGLRAADRERIAADLGRYALRCRRLADGGIPATLQHDDLHDDNVFVAGGRHRFFDWGDAAVAHPFLVLLVALRMAAAALDVPPGDPALVRLRDAYLEPWSSFGTTAALREQVDLALAVGPLSRAVTWARILRGVHPAERAEWAGAVPGWTATHLDPGPLQPSS